MQLKHQNAKYDCAVSACVVCPKNKSSARHCPVLPTVSNNRQCLTDVLSHRHATHMDMCNPCLRAPFTLNNNIISY